jgi:hypothetical protein
MINGLMGGSSVIVNGGNTSVPYVNQNSSNPMQGMVRIWGSDMQVFDGSAWITMTTSYATVDLTPDAQSLLQWAREHRDKQLKREERIKNNPGLQKAWENIKRAEENFDLIDALVKDYTHDETTQGN